MRVMMRWLGAFVPKPGHTIPGISDEDVAELTTPTLIIRGGEHDLDLPKRTSLELSCLIPGSRLVEPPWVQAAPLILEFAERVVSSA